jgi:hypothetical protein
MSSVVKNVSGINLLLLNSMLHKYYHVWLPSFTHKLLLFGIDYRVDLHLVASTSTRNCQFPLLLVFHELCFGSI